jgi:Uma2 family endonuclease
MSAIIEQLLEEPTLPETVALLTARLDDERIRRERFHDELRPDQKAEFINGQVVMHSPAKSRHLEVTANLLMLLRTFTQVQQLGLVYCEKALCVFPRNDYEPDIVFFGVDKARQITPETLKFPVPDFICEVLSESTEASDRGIKFRDYAAHGVAEYWIVDPEREVLEQYVSQNGGFELNLKSGSGDVVSPTVSGFAIPVRALFDASINLSTLQSLLSAAP